MQPIIGIKYFTNKWRKYIENLKYIAKNVLKGRNIYIQILLVNDQIIRKINNNYRSIDAPTDVLSFPVKNAFYKTRMYFGDVIISYEYIWEKSQCDEKIFKKKIALILVHGILHLLGYDHEDEFDAIRMRSIETLILCSLGRHLSSNDF